MKLRKRLACMIILVLGLLCMPQMANAAEKTIDYEKQYVVLSLEGHTLGQGFYLLPEKMSYSEIAAEWKKQNVELDLSNLTVAQATYAFFSRAGLKTIPELGADYNTEEFYLSCVKGIDTGKTDIPKIIQDTYKERHSKALVLTEKTGMDLGEFDYSETSGWMVSVDNSFISEGAGSYVLDAEIEDGSVHVVRWQFTVTDKGADLGYDTTSFGGAATYYTLQDKGALYIAYAENVEALKQDSDTLAAVLKVMNTLDVSKEEIKGAVDRISGDEEVPADGKAAVTIQMNAISKTMSLKNAAGDLMDTGEPEGYIYRLRLEPGTYTLTGYAADGVTENGSIDLVVSEEEEQSYTFYTVTKIYCTNADWVRDTDYTMSLSVIDADNTNRHAVFGQTSADVSYASALCYAGDTVSVTVTPTELRTAEYMPKTVSYTITANKTTGYNITAPLARKVTITIPTGADIRVGTLSNYFIYEDIEAEGEAETEDDMDTWHYRFAEGPTYYYRVSMPGGVTYWDWISVKEDTAYEVTKEDLYIGDSSFSPDTVIDDLSVNKYDVADLYMNGNEKGYISLKNGETKKLECFRNWQAIEGISNAKTAEPDFHYEVIDVNGNASTDVIEVTTGKNSAQAEITAVGKGTAIVLVTYDAMTSTVGMGGKLFSAIWPENTGVLVVTVDEDGTAIHTGMTIQEGKNETALKLSGDKLDAELDVLYYQKGEDGAEYTFYPEGGVSVAVMHPEYVNGALTYKGFSEGDVKKNEDGSYTVKGLVQGSNLVRITKNGVSTYQVIRAKEVNITCEYKDVDGNSISEKELKAGCSIEITYGERSESGTAYHGLYIPANKLAGIYNMSGTVCLEDAKGNLYTGKGNQYLFAGTATAQTITVNIPEDYVGDTFSLSGYIKQSGFGSAYGLHRNLSHETGKTAQFTAVSCTGYMGRLPELEFALEEIIIEKQEQEIILSKDVYQCFYDTKEAEEGFQIEAVAESTLSYTSSDADVAEVDEEGNIRITGIGEAEITVTAEENEYYLAAEAVVTVIVQGELSKATISEIGDQVYTGEALMPECQVSCYGFMLQENKDYIVSYTDNTEIGTAMVEITGIGSYTGSITATFLIVEAKQEIPEKKELTKDNIKVRIDDQTYTGKAIEPEVVVWFKEQLLNSNDYTVTYENNIEAGTAICTIQGRGAYTGTVTATFEIKKAVQSITGVQESYKKVYGSGSFTLKAEAKTPLTYESLNTKVVKVGEKTGKVTIVGCGKAVIRITAEEGSYEKAEKLVTVKVVPRQQKIKALKKASKGAFHIRLKKDAKASGYQIVYSTSKNFTKAKKINISGYKKIKRTVKGLKSGKRYYVKARAYVKQGNEKYYGAYSRVKRIVIK